MVKKLLQLLRHLKFALFCWGADAQTSKALLDDKSRRSIFGLMQDPGATCWSIEARQGARHNTIFKFD